MLVRTATSEKGRQADFCVLTDFDDDRTLAEICSEIAAEHGWTFEKAKSKLNFGVRNTRQGECARASEMTAKAIATKLDAIPGILLVKYKTSQDQKDLDRAMEISSLLNGANTAQYAVLYKQLFPNGALGRNGDTLIGAEANVQDHATADADDHDDDLDGDSTNT